VRIEVVLLPKQGDGQVTVYSTDDIRSAQMYPHVPARVLPVKSKLEIEIEDLKHRVSMLEKIIAGLVQNRCSGDVDCKDLPDADLSEIPYYNVR